MSSNCTILIIDDEPFLRSTLGMILQRVGYSCEEAGDFAEALRKASMRKYRLIFLDLQLPDGSGIDFLPELRKLQPQVPVVVLTANGSLEKAIGALRNGAYDYLLKPIDPGQIITHVDDILWQYPEIAADTAGAGTAGADTAAEAGIEDVGTLKAEMKDLPASQQPEIQVPDVINLGDFYVDVKNRTAHVKHRNITFPACTFEYLVTLLQHSPHPVSYFDLVGESQGYLLTPIEAQDLARWRIYRLRKVIEETPNDPQYILSVPGFGFKLVTQTTR